MHSMPTARMSMNAIAQNEDNMTNNDLSQEHLFASWEPLTIRGLLAEAHRLGLHLPASGWKDSDEARKELCRLYLERQQGITPVPTCVWCHQPVDPQTRLVVE